MIAGCSGPVSARSRGRWPTPSSPSSILDEHFWNPAWIETPDTEFDGVMDGNYSRTLHHRLLRAQVVVVLAFPTWLCLWGVFKRAVLFWDQTQPDFPEGCAEQLPGWQFLWWIISYRWRSRPKVLRRIADAPHVNFYRLKNRRAVRQLMEELSRQSSST
ncbi:MAG: hypothetical protein HOD00_11720 [Gemmatimonadales bacterium]|jgi:adenylate kinase family enzyme|nr:hypothetical protein [Gemmatimonadales bacterium]MDG2241555.1 hypothetical protein [Longimicrobiales bacterium]MBT3959734.1 hypothetical protein [Gemmatimonadales bacterium]MBT4185672.1 hypothetical protein [Gemmatimonadales bacterium]MBT4438178.1 hypothetical protein [Gemmatimonadales bacterium]